MHSTPQHTFYTPAYYIPTCILYPGIVHPGIHFIPRHIISRHAYFTPACILYPGIHFIPRHAYYIPTCILYPGMHFIPQHAYYIPTCILYPSMHFIPRHAYYIPEWILYPDMHIIHLHAYYIPACILYPGAGRDRGGKQFEGVGLSYSEQKRLQCNPWLVQDIFRTDQIFSNIEGPRFFQSEFTTDPKINRKRLKSVQFESIFNCKKQIIYQWSLLWKITDYPFIP